MEELLPEKAPPEKHGEAASLVDEISKLAAGLDAERLAPEALKHAVERLTVIAEKRREASAELRAQLQTWQESHAEALTGAAELGSRLATINARIGAGGMNKDRMEAVLSFFETVLDLKSQSQKTRAECKQALAKDDFVSVSSLAAGLQSLKSECDAACAAIDKTLAVPAETPSVDEHKAEPDAAPDEGALEPKPAPERESEPPAEYQGGNEPEPSASRKEEPLDDAAPAGEVAKPDREDISTERIEKEIAKTLERGRLGVAYHLALATPDALPGAKAIKLIACNYVTDERAPVAAVLPGLTTELRDEAEKILKNGPGTLSSYASLMACAALAPARIAPGGPVAQLLSFLAHYLGDMPSLQALATTVGDVSMKGIYLSIELLREDDSLERWTARGEALRSETENWIEKERQARLKFHVATKVWRRILNVWENNGRASVGRMFELLAEPADNIDIDRAAAIARHWREHREKEIDRIHRDIRSGASHKIEGSARLDLRNKIDEAITFSDSRRSLIEARPDKRPEFHTKQANILQGAVRKNAEAALAEIDRSAAPPARQAQDLLRRYAAIFNDMAADDPAAPMRLLDLLNGDLLANPDIRFDDEGRPSETPVDIDLLLHLTSQDNPDFKGAAVERAKSGDFFNAEKTVDFAERSGILGNGEAKGARDRVDLERMRIHTNFEDRVSKTSNRLDAAYAQGVLQPEIFEQRRDEIPSDDLSRIDRFEPFFETLDRIDKDIEIAREDRRGNILQALNQLKDISQEDKKRIETALDNGQFPVAEDFMERIERGEKLPATDAKSNRPFDSFFQKFVKEYAVFRNENRDALAQSRQLLENRACMGPINAAQLSEDAARDGRQILKTWQYLSGRRTTVDALQTLMRTLGFKNVKVCGSDTRTTLQEIVFWLDADPVADRRTVQLPDFGSGAKGRYRLLVIRKRTSEEAIVREAEERSMNGGPPNIVLFLNFLDIDSRRGLARRLGSGRYRPTLVLDEALIVFLAVWSGDRLGAFFDCASAFTYAQPFDPDATEVPPEMFFGRDAALRAIRDISSDMTHLVYGGRRLGKTVLLAKIAREYHEEHAEQLAFLVNLKGSGIGENQPTEDLWRMFAERLAKHKICTPQTVRRDSVEKSVKRWLQEKLDRRILFLVDEADAFFDIEGKEKYSVLEQIKRLMEETERRFKVVFTGLHNVQRAARDPNTPFAHLGKPIRIGPMLPETDGSEIENLIRDPLEALGYRFASNDSVIRIAAEMNYYPALVQQFCKELLRELREDIRMRNEEGPPYTISQDTVNRVFDSKETRDRIRNLFSWTIQLDPRYEFLTYLIAKQSLVNNIARPCPTPIADVRDTALSEWPQGFESDSSFWMFEVLLEEMTGLGILRETADKEYAIRTRNLRMLLGNDDEIERRFADAKRRPAPPAFNPAQFRKTLHDETPSSLTAGQENQLLSRLRIVGFVFGTRLAGIDRVGESLKRTAEGRDVRLHNADLASMDSSLSQISRSRKPGIDLVLIDTRGAWEPEQIRGALTFVAEHDTQNRIVRPVFLCGPGEARTWLNEARPTPPSQVELRDIWLGPCARNFVRSWLKDREAPAYACLENPDQTVDMPWPVVAGAAACQDHPQPIADAVSLALANGDLISDVFVTPQIKSAFRVLSALPDDPLTADDLSELSEEKDSRVSAEEAVRFFNWADRLGIVLKDGQGYRLDSTYAAGFRGTFTK